MKIYILIIFLLAVSVSSFGQDIPASRDLGEKNPYPFLTSRLWDVSKSAEKSVEEGIAKAASFFMLVREESVYVEVVRGSSNDLELSIDEEYLRTIPNIEINTVWKNRASIWIKVNKILSIGKNLRKGYHLVQAIQGDEDNEGPALMNSDSYNVPGAGGAGMNVAIIDGGFSALTASQNAGAAPTAANTTEVDYTGGGIEAGGRHGTACVETVFDHAPNADYFLYKIGSLSDLGTAVTQCIADDVNVISHSLSFYNQGWWDNTGPACIAAAHAAENGILFFTSAGNRNGTHVQENFSSPDGDSWHNWEGGNDEKNDFTIDGDPLNTAVVKARLQWKSNPTVDHYDLYLFEAGTDVLIQSSTNVSNFEEIIYSSNDIENVYLAVWANTPNPPEFEIFNHDRWCSNFEYASFMGSSTSPSNTTARNVISVGAVPMADYHNPTGALGILADNSSHGPTNDGNMAPDVCAPTGTSTFTYVTTNNPNGEFTGTSAATANAAGAAAAFWSGHPFLGSDGGLFSSSGVKEILVRKAALYKDWGMIHPDNAYGNGGMFLFDYHEDNRYITKSTFNFGSDPSLPYYSIELVDDTPTVPANKRMIYLDWIDVAPGVGKVINKPMKYNSIIGTFIN